MTTDSAALLSDAAIGGAEATPDTARRNKLVINLLLVSSFVVILNETIMSVAIPHLMGDLGVTAGAAQWLTTAFLLTMAVVIPITGFLIQRFNTRPIFIAAMTLFSLGTLICAASPGIELLIVGRVVQAMGTAIMMPLLMTTVMTLVPPDARGKTMGNISIVMSVAPAIGPTISGIILDTLHDWRYLFILVLPIGLGALALGWRRIVNVTEPRYAPLDIVSVILSAFAFGGIVYGLSSLGGEGSHGGGEAGLPAWVPLGIGVVAMAIFIARQLMLQRKDAALLDLRTFKSSNFSFALLLMAIMMMAMFGSIVVLPIYLQTVLGMNTLNIGLLLLPGGLLMGLLGPQVGKLYDRIGPSPLLIPGVIIVSAVMWAMTLLGADTWWGYILAGHIIMSIGFALLFTPLFTVSLSSVQPRLYSHGSAVLGSIQQVAGAAGVALLVAVLTSGTAGLAAGGADPTEALAGGVRSAFLVAAVISLFAVAASFFVRRPPAVEGGGHFGH